MCDCICFEASEHDPDECVCGDVLDEHDARTGACLVGQEDDGE